MTTTPARPWMDDEALIASVDLIGRTGGRHLEIGHSGDEDSTMDEVTWHAWCNLRQVGAAGVRMIEDGHPDPVTAVEALAVRLLSGATCTHCKGLIALSAEGAVITPGTRMADGSTMTVARARSLRQCHWQRVGARWVRGCEGTYPVVPSGTVTVTGPTPNRAERRAFRRGGRRG